MIAAFTGWNDAGSAASSLIAHLATLWGAVKYTELDPEKYQDFQVNRPVIARGEDGRKRIVWPATSVWIARLPHRTYVLVDGVEPSLNWRQYCDELLNIAHDLNVSLVITVGALLADVPHTRPLPVTVTSDNPELQESMNLDFSDYEGPTGIVGVFQNTATLAGIDSVAMWVAVPHYVSEAPSPQATMVLLNRMELLVGDSIDLGNLPDAASAWADEIKEMIDDDEDILEYVRHLEEASDTVEAPEAKGDAIAKEFETWLKKQ